MNINKLILNRISLYISRVRSGIEAVTSFDFEWAKRYFTP